MDDRIGFPPIAERKKLCEHSLKIARAELYEAHLQVIGANARENVSDSKAWSTEREKRRRKVLALEDELRLIETESEE